ncbi:16S rRNA (uracil(1498)-N(3))-methyltransferase [Corynebacterium aquatimens]|uniref:Ribosomal RNA small subunit methyltransferase E n=1 Tax=Corynebacterium aquatimens TaxID=1190508 RepID=A0A931GTS1_9CORY|nr:16S rRNA (uracil(1498)-N(3))-methyltransferase [Corynebacterium aquatimens]MBG6122085.1 16S rRNA (uracil1498-N3)-methyltransferase [Corynebacterium aquatimens]WJY65374.1 Ribosomal RNA small subunit methyltransferase E [Corynebacterium aquatimens]
MSLPYFITNNPTSGELTGREGRHAVTVKRIQPGEYIMLTDGEGTLVEVCVESTSGKDTLRGRVVDTQRSPQPTPRVTVIQAVPKSDRAELAVDLLTQGGADTIIPWISARTIARWEGPKTAKHVEKWRTIAAESSKQARRAWVPDVAEPVTTKQLAEMIAGYEADNSDGVVRTMVLVLHEDARLTLGTWEPDAFEDTTHIVLIIGPEGGIGEDEADALVRAGALMISLGPEVLRTASAGFAALGALGVLTQRWKR